MAVRPAMTREDVERGYNNRAAVPDHPHWLDQFADALARRGRGAVAAARFALRQRAEGNARSVRARRARRAERCCSFTAATGARSTRPITRSSRRAFVAAGFAVAVVNYDLCPDVTIATIVDAMPPRGGLGRAAKAGARRAGAAGHRRAFGRRPPGGDDVRHRLAAHGFDAAPFVGGVSLSGVHDLEPLVLFTHNADFRLDEASARACRPIHHTPQVDVPLVIAVGADETSEFVRQSQLLWDAWPRTSPATAGWTDVDRRAAPFQRRARLRGSRKCADARNAGAAATAHAASADSIRRAGGRCRLRRTDAPLR